MEPRSCRCPGQTSETSGSHQGDRAGVRGRSRNPTLGNLHCGWGSGGHYSSLRDRLQVIMRQCQPGSKRSHSTNRDFTYFYTEFKEAYHKASRAVAMAWTRARTLAEPGMSSDTEKISAVEATAAKIRKLDDQRKHAEARKQPKKTPTASFLRQPGKGAEVEEEE